MSTVSKFEFDTVFDLDEKGRARQKPPDPTFTEAELIAARGEAQQLGYEAGLAQARREIEQSAADALQAIAASMPEVAERQVQAILAVKEDAANLAYMVATKLAPTLVARAPEEEIKGLLADCLATMMEEPRLVIRLPEALMDGLPEALEQVAQQVGFEGKLVVIGEPALQGSDCRIEWADGGLERDMDAVTAKVSAAIERYCAGVRDQIERLDAAADAEPELQFEADGERQGEEAPCQPDAPAMPDFEELPGGVEQPLPAMNVGSAGTRKPRGQTDHSPVDPAGE